MWDAEMVPYCGGTYRVLKRVSRIIDEKTGLMKRELENVFVRDELYKREIVAHAAPSPQEIAEGMARIVKEVQVLSFLVRSESEGASLAHMLSKCKTDSVLQNIAR